MQNTSNILGGKLASIIWNNSKIQSGASSRRKIGGAYFSDVTGSIQDPIAVPGPCEKAAEALWLCGAKEKLLLVKTAIKI